MDCMSNMTLKLKSKLKDTKPALSSSGSSDDMTIATPARPCFLARCTAPWNRVCQRLDERFPVVEHDLDDISSRPFSSADVYTDPAFALVSPTAVAAARTQQWAALLPPIVTDTTSFMAAPAIVGTSGVIDFDEPRRARSRPAMGRRYARSPAPAALRLDTTSSSVSTTATDDDETSSLSCLSPGTPAVEAAAERFAHNECFETKEAAFTAATAREQLRRRRSWTSFDDGARQPDETARLVDQDDDNLPAGAYWQKLQPAEYPDSDDYGSEHRVAGVDEGWDYCPPDHPAAGTGCLCFRTHHQQHPADQETEACRWTPYMASGVLANGLRVGYGVLTEAEAFAAWYEHLGGVDGVGEILPYDVRMERGGRTRVAGTSCPNVEVWAENLRWRRFCQAKAWEEAASRGE